jgi:type IV pilus assembly protein PilV
MRKRNQLIQASAQRGFSIVEAMVALLVLSIGMLGIAGLYVTTLRASGSALYRTHAVNLAADMADRIRANPTAGNAYADDVGADNGCVANAPGIAAACNPAALAADDVFRWQQQISGVLPDTDGDPNTGPGTIDVDAGSPRTYTIRVFWMEPTDPNALSYTLRMQI